MSTDKKIDYILRTVEERDVRYLRLCFTDVLGGLKALSISPEELEEAFVEREQVRKRKIGEKGEGGNG